MFRKILIANRGEIAVRIIRACRQLGIATAALYQPTDRNSLHVRLADECFVLESPEGFMDQQAIIRIAQECKADAIHPGYGFLAEREDFLRACEAAEVQFIGAPATVLEALHNKIEVQNAAQKAGFPTPAHSRQLFETADLPALHEEAVRLGFPLAIKSSRGGRGRGERVVWSLEGLGRAVRRAQAESQAVYGERQVYLEKAISPAHQVGVQVMGDRYGNLIHLGDREGSLLYGNQKVIEEAPAACLDAEQRRQLWHSAIELARLFNIQNIATVEFIVDKAGQFYFTEIKPRIQIVHPITEMLSRVDLVQEQIRLAAGGALTYDQSQINLQGWAMQCRIRAQDPWGQFLPSPGRVHQVRWPGGAEVRVDTYLFCGCTVPGEYDPLIAKLVVWGPDRPSCIQRMRQAIQECQLVGVATNLPLIHQMLEQPEFLLGEYSSELLMGGSEGSGDEYLHFRDLAAIAALMYTRQNRKARPASPARIISGWRRSNRLPGE